MAGKRGEISPYNDISNTPNLVIRARMRRLRLINEAYREAQEIYSGASLKT